MNNKYSKSRNQLTMRGWLGRDDLTRWSRFNLTQFENMWIWKHESLMKWWRFDEFNQLSELQDVLPSLRLPYPGQRFPHTQVPASIYSFYPKFFQTRDQDDENTEACSWKGKDWGPGIIHKEKNSSPGGSHTNKFLCVALLYRMFSRWFIIRTFSRLRNCTKLVRNAIMKIGEIVNKIFL